MALRIIFTQTEVTLDESSFSVVLQNNQLEDLSNRRLSYTNRFSLPKTSANLQLLQDVGLLGSDTRIYNDNIPASIFLDETPIIENGVANILETTLDSINFQIVSSVKTLRDRLAKLSIRDIDYEELNHVVSIENIQRANSSENSPYVYTNTNFLQEGFPEPSLYIRNLHPFIKERWILDKILEGIEVEGEIPNEDVLVSLERGLETQIQSPSRSTTDRGRTTTIGGGVTRISGEPFGGLNTRPTVIVPEFESTLERLPTRTIDFALDDILGPANFQKPEIVRQDTQLQLAEDTLFIRLFNENINQEGRYAYAFEDSSAIEIQSNDVKPESISGQKNLLLITYKENEQQGFRFLEIEKNQAEIFTDNQVDRLEIYLVLQLRGLSQIGDIRRVDIERGEIKLRGTTRGSIFDFDFNRDFISLLITGSIVYGRELLSELPQVKFGELLPDISQLDFFKEILWRYGLLIASTNDPNKIRIASLDSILRDEDGKRIDWSNNFVSLENKTHTINFGQINHFRYEDYEGYDNYADGNFEISKPSAPPLKEVIQSRYRFDKPQQAYLDNLTNQRFRVPIYGNLSDGVIQSTNVSPTIFRQTTLGQQVVRVDSFRSGTVPLWELTQNGLVWCQLVPDHYGALRQVAELNESVKAQFRLDAETIFNLDLFSTFYVKQLNSNFYINKILNFVPGRPTTVELIKLPNEFQEVSDDEKCELEEGRGSESISGEDLGCILNVEISTDRIRPTPRRGAVVQSGRTVIPINSYTRQRFNFRISGGSGRGYGIYALYAHRATIRITTYSRASGVGFFEVDPERSFSETGTRLKTIELIAYDSDGNCGKKRILLVVNDVASALRQRDREIYIIPPDKNHVVFGNEFVVQHFIASSRTIGQLADGTLTPSIRVQTVGEPGVRATTSYDVDTANKIVTVRVAHTVDLENFTNPSSEQILFFKTSASSRATYTTRHYVLLRNLRGLNSIGFSWLNEANTDINSRVWNISRTIDEPNTHTLAAAGIMSTAGGVPPYRIEIGNRPSEFLADSSIRYLMDFNQTSEIAKSFDALIELEDETDSIPRPHEDDLFIAPENQRYGKAIAIYTRASIDTRQTQERFLNVKITDSSPTPIVTTQRLVYQYRVRGPIDLGTLPLPEPDADCVNTDFGDNITISFVFTENGIRRETPIRPVSLISEGYGPNRIVIPLHDEQHEDVEYKLRWLFPRGKAPYVHTAEVIEVVFGTGRREATTIQACAGIPIESGFDITNQEIEENVTSTQDEFIVTFRTRENAFTPTVDPYWIQGIRVSLLDSCFPGNSKEVDFPILIQNLDRDPSAPALSLSGDIDLEYTVGVEQEVDVTTISSYQARLLCNEDGIFSISSGATGIELTGSATRKIGIVANDVDGRYNETGFEVERSALLQVKTPNREERLEVKAFELTRGRACLTIPSLSIGVGDLCSELDPAPTITAGQATVDKEAQALTWVINVAPNFTQFPYRVLVEGSGGSLETLNGSQTGQRELFEVSSGILRLTENEGSIDRSFRLILEYSSRQEVFSRIFLNITQEKTVLNPASLDIVVEPAGVLVAGGVTATITLTPTPSTDSTTLIKQALPRTPWATLTKVRDNVWSLVVAENPLFIGRSVNVIYASDSIDEQTLTISQAAKVAARSDFDLEFIRWGSQEAGPTPVDPCETQAPTIAISPRFRTVEASPATIGGSITTSFTYTETCADTITPSFNFGSFPEFVSAVVDTANNRVDLVITPNTSSVVRTATLQLEATNKNGSARDSVSINQRASTVPTLIVSPDTFKANRRNAEATFTYQITNAVQGDLRITAKPDWATQKTFTGGNLVFTLTDNNGYGDRSGVVTIVLSNTNGFVTRNVTITQTGRATPTEAPTINISSDKRELANTFGQQSFVNYQLTNAERQDVVPTIIPPEVDWFEVDAQEGTESLPVAIVRVTRVNPTTEPRSATLRLTVTTPVGSAFDEVEVEQSANPAGRNLPEIVVDNSEITVNADGTENAVFSLQLRLGVTPISSTGTPNLVPSGLLSWVTAGPLTYDSTDLRWKLSFDVTRNTGNERRDTIRLTFTVGTDSTTEDVTIVQSEAPAEPTINLIKNTINLSATATSANSAFTFANGVIGDISGAETGANIIRSQSFASGSNPGEGVVTFAINRNVSSSQRTSTFTATISNTAGSGTDTIAFTQAGIVSREPTITITYGSPVNLPASGSTGWRVGYTLTNAGHGDVIFPRDSLPTWIPDANLGLVANGIIGFSVSANSSTSPRSFNMVITVRNSGGSDTATIPIFQLGDVPQPTPRPSITIRDGDVSVDADGSENYVNRYSLTNANDVDINAWVNADFLRLSVLNDFPDWFEAVPTYGSGNISVNVKANETFVAREFELGLEVNTDGGTDYGFFVVKQDAKERPPAPDCVIGLSPSARQDIGAVGGSLRIEVEVQNASTALQFSSDEVWLTSGGFSRDGGKGFVTINVARNVSGQVRTGTVTISSANSANKRCFAEIDVRQSNILPNRPTLTITDPTSQQVFDAVAINEEILLDYTKTNLTNAQISLLQPPAGMELVVGDTQLQFIYNGNNATFDNQTISVTVRGDNGGGQVDQQITFIQEGRTPYSAAPVITLADDALEFPSDAEETDELTSAITLQNADIRYDVSASTTDSANLSARVFGGNLIVTKVRDRRLLAAIIANVRVDTFYLNNGVRTAGVDNDALTVTQASPPARPKPTLTLGSSSESFSATDVVDSTKNVTFSVTDASARNDVTATSSDSSNVAVTVVVLNNLQVIRLTRKSGSAFTETITVTVSTTGGSVSKTISVTGVAIPEDEESDPPNEQVNAPSYTGVELYLETTDLRFASTDAIGTKKLVYYDVNNGSLSSATPNNNQIRVRFVRGIIDALSPFGGTVNTALEVEKRRAGSISATIAVVATGSSGSTGQRITVSAPTNTTIKAENGIINYTGVWSNETLIAQEPPFASEYFREGNVIRIGFKTVFIIQIDLLGGYTAGDLEELSEMNTQNASIRTYLSNNGNKFKNRAGSSGVFYYFPGGFGRNNEPLDIASTATRFWFIAVNRSIRGIPLISRQLNFRVDVTFTYAVTGQSYCRTIALNFFSR